MVIEAPQGRPEFWPRQLVKKWLSLRQTGNRSFKRDTHMDTNLDIEENGDVDDNGDEFNVDISHLHENTDLSVVEVAPPSNPLSLLRGQSETLRQQFVEDHELRVGVHSWNVAGKPPPQDLDLEEWINDSQPADIYVFGFQEIVPLNANNVLCVEDREPATKWEAKIREYLNNRSDPRNDCGSFQSRSAPSSPRNDDMVISISEVSDVEKLLSRCVSGKNLETAFLASEGNLLNYEKNLTTQIEERPLDRNNSNEEALSASEGQFAIATSEITTRDLHDAVVADELLSEKANLVGPMLSSTDSVCYPPAFLRHKYSCVASKQMVGIFITVWVRSQLWRHVHSVKVSAVGLGLMHYLGNKGAISVSLCLHHTTFCFVCSHLTSGDKEGDQLRRNADFAEILRRTKFPRLMKLFGFELPEVILTHDRVIWLGDLNYRLALPDKEIWRYVKYRDWEYLLRKDQLKLEQGEGRVFKDWQEGPIHFPPTYKYKEGTDQFSGEASSTGEKRRTPAWCDRILWYGKGLKQVAYTHGELKLSDHRSVCATFMAEVEIISHRKLKKACICPKNITLDQFETEEKTTSFRNKVSLKRSQKFRRLARASSFVYPEFSFSSARAWRGDEPSEVISYIFTGVRIGMEEYLENQRAATLRNLFDSRLCVRTTIWEPVIPINGGAFLCHDHWARILRVTLKTAPWLLSAIEEIQQTTLLLKIEGFSNQHSRACEFYASEESRTALRNRM